MKTWISLIFIIILLLATALMFGASVIMLQSRKIPESVMDNDYKCSICDWTPQSAQQVEQYCYDCGKLLGDEDIIGTHEHKDTVYLAEDYTSYFICPKCLRIPDGLHRASEFCPFCGAKEQLNS